MPLFRIEGGRYGGETVIGSVDKEFVDSMLDADQEDLIDHLTSCDDEDFEGTLPSEDYYMWECDDIEHINSAYADGGFFVTEVSEEDKYEYSENETEYSDGEIIQLYGREAYAQDEEPLKEDIKEGDDYVPVVMFHSSEKGAFGCWFVDTGDQPFDKLKLTYGIVETNMGYFIDTVYYDEIELECEYDNNDSTGKGYYAEVGYLNKKWHDSYDKYISEEDMKIYWEDYADNVDYHKEENKKEII
tara:strand:+ start:987 stop:1718 length:732 start_codon:yes stop_codon:yes gene_type:complete